MAKLRQKVVAKQGSGVFCVDWQQGNAKRLWRYQLTRRGVHSSFGHSIGKEKVVTFAAVPQVIEHGQIIGTQKDCKGRRYDTVTFDGRIKIAGVDYDMGVIVKKYDNTDMSSKYYVHEVLLSDKKKDEAAPIQTRTGLEDPMGYPRSATSSYIDSIPQMDGKSKVILTEMLDAQKRPVMVPIHLDKQERIGVSNDITSVYDSENFDKSIQQ